MKGYPLIYSRTKYFDFVPDFLVRPNDIDVTNSLKYVQNTLMNIDLLDGIRYSVFSVGELYICIGISCISKKLIQFLNKDSNASVNKAAEPYLKDVKGRNIASFIGVAIPSTEIKNGVIPSISLKEYLDIYIEYLSHQWNSETETESEKLTSPTLEIKAKKYDSLFMPDIEKIADKSVVKNYSYYQEKTLDYCFMNTTRDKNFSFISDISDRTEWRNLIFTSASITPELLRSLKSLESELEAKRDPDPSDGEVSIKRNTAYRENNIQTQDGDIRIRTTQQQPQQAQKKTKNSGSIVTIAMIIAAILIISVLVLMLK